MQWQHQAGIGVLREIDAGVALVEGAFEVGVVRGEVRVVELVIVRELGGMATFLAHLAPHLVKKTQFMTDLPFLSNSLPIVLSPFGKMSLKVTQSLTMLLKECLRSSWGRVQFKSWTSLSSRLRMVAKESNLEMDSILDAQLGLACSAFAFSLDRVTELRAFFWRSSSRSACSLALSAFLMRCEALLGSLEGADRGVVGEAAVGRSGNRKLIEVIIMLGLNWLEGANLNQSSGSVSLGFSSIFLYSSLDSSRMSLAKVCHYSGVRAASPSLSYCSKRREVSSMQQSSSQSRSPCRSSSCMMLMNSDLSSSPSLSTSYSAKCTLTFSSVQAMARAARARRRRGRSG